MSEKNLYRRKGVYYARFKINGRDERRSLRTGVKAIALRRIRAVRDRADNAALTGQDTHPWKEVVVEWRAAMIGAVKKTALNRYILSLNAVRTIMDGLCAEEVTTKTIAKIVRDRRATGATNATIKRDLTAVSSVLRYCCAQGWREDNPAKAYDRSVIRERRDPIVLPDLVDIDAAVSMAHKNFGNLIRCAQYTGMRQDEIVTLERPQVRRKEGVIDLWKTKTSRPRAIPIDERAGGTLDGTPVHISCRWVFWHNDEDPRPYRNVASRFRQMIRRGVKAKKIGRAFRFHDLRHWYAVDYLRRGGNLYDLQKILGHSSIRTTEIYLAYLTPEQQRVAKFGKAAQNWHSDGGSRTDTEVENVG